VSAGPSSVAVADRSGTWPAHSGQVCPSGQACSAPSQEPGSAEPRGIHRRRRLGRFRRPARAVRAAARSDRGRLHCSRHLGCRSESGSAHPRRRGTSSACTPYRRGNRSATRTRFQRKRCDGPPRRSRFARSRCKFGPHRRAVRRGRRARSGTLRPPAAASRQRTKNPQLLPDPVGKGCRRKPFRPTGHRRYRRLCSIHRPRRPQPSRTGQKRSARSRTTECFPKRRRTSRDPGRCSRFRPRRAACRRRTDTTVPDHSPRRGSTDPSSASRSRRRHGDPFRKQRRRRSAHRTTGSTGLASRLFSRVLDHSLPHIRDNRVNRCSPTF
jgi:hypothetical protein